MKVTNGHATRRSLALAPTSWQPGHQVRSRTQAAYHAPVKVAPRKPKPMVKAVGIFTQRGLATARLKEIS